VSFTATTQKYRTWNRIVFDPAESCDGCAEDDEFTNLNPVYVGAITKVGGEDTNLVLMAGVPYYTQKALQGTSCHTPDPLYAETTYPAYANASSVCGTLDLPGNQSQLLNQAICCVLSDATKAQSMLQSINAALNGGDMGAISIAKTIFAQCGFNTDLLPQGDFLAVAACMLSYWGVPNDLIPPEPQNLVAQVMADASSTSFVKSIIVKDGLVTTKSVKEWYLGGPSPLAQVLLGNKAAAWPGFADSHDVTLIDATTNPKNKLDEVYSGCGGSGVNISQYKVSQGVSYVNYSYWSTKEIMVPVSGGPGEQTVPVLSSALGGGQPQSNRQYLYSPQLKRPVAMHYTREMTVKGIEANRFEIVDNELKPGGFADIPGLTHVKKSEIGVGQNSCERSSSCLQAFTPSELNGLVDQTPQNGFAAFVSRPHFDSAAPTLLEKITLIADATANPDHSTYLVVEPASGKTILGHERLQLASGIMFDSEIFFPTSNKSKGILLPVYWIDQYAEITDSDLNLFSQAVTLYKTSMWSLVVGSSTGAVFLLVALWLFYEMRCCCGSAQPYDAEQGRVSSDDERRSSLIEARHSKPVDGEERVSWHDRCSQMKDAATDMSKRFSQVSQDSYERARASMGYDYEPYHRQAVEQGVSVDRQYRSSV